MQFRGDWDGGKIETKLHDSERAIKSCLTLSEAYEKIKEILAKFKTNFRIRYIKSFNDFTMKIFQNDIYYVFCYVWIIISSISIYYLFLYFPIKYIK